MTIEDPVEYVFPSINQIQINEQAGITFAGGLKSILRQDPDVILVGEIRDVETARIAVQSALTGHFVLSSLHATDASSALHRLLDMGIEPFLIAPSVTAVVGQRLVRRICRDCCDPYQPPSRGARVLRQPRRRRPKDVFFHGEGCNFCSETGYQERIGVYEVMRITDEMRAADRRGAVAGADARAGDRGGHAHVAATKPCSSSPKTSPPSPRSCGASTRFERLIAGVCNSMAKYSYTGVSQAGQPQKGVIEADHVNDVRIALVDRELYGIEVSEKHEHPEDRDHQEARAKRVELMHFSRQLGAFVRAGIPIIDAIETLRVETANDQFRKVLADVAEQLRSGDAALGRLRVAPGGFPVVLRQHPALGRDHRSRRRCARPVRRLHRARPRGPPQDQVGATYPWSSSAVAIVAVVVLVTFVLPKFQTFFDALDAKLPLPTRMLLSITNFITN